MRKVKKAQLQTVKQQIKCGDTVKYNNKGVNLYPYVLYVKDGCAKVVITNSIGEEETEIVQLYEITKIGNNTKYLKLTNKNK